MASTLEHAALLVLCCATGVVTMIAFVLIVSIAVQDAAFFLTVVAGLCLGVAVWRRLTGRRS